MKISPIEESKSGRVGAMEYANSIYSEAGTAVTVSKDVTTWLKSSQDAAKAVAVSENTIISARLRERNRRKYLFYNITFLCVCQVLWNVSAENTAQGNRRGLTYHTATASRPCLYPVLLVPPDTVSKEYHNLGKKGMSPCVIKKYRKTTTQRVVKNMRLCYS